MNNLIHIIIAIFLTTAASCALSGCFQSSTVDRDEPTISSVPSLDQDNSAIPMEPADGDSTTVPLESEASFEYRQLSEADLARSSWENPFLPHLWSCEGWTIEADAMTCESGTALPATFLRPYRNGVIECRLSRSVDDASVEELSPIEFELRLLNLDTRRWAALSHASDKVTLSESQKDETQTQPPLRASSDIINNESKNIDVRLTMTPNRILVAINGQIRINSRRPASILNAECLSQFVVRERGVTISDVRFEGD